MDNETFVRLSFLATIAFGLAALGGLLIAALALHATAAAVAALLALGAAYAAQALATYSVQAPVLVKPGLAMQLLSCLLFVIGLTCL